MPSFDDMTNMTTVAAALYFLGVYFHYVHVKTIFHLLDRYEDLNKTKAIFHIITWTITVLVLMWDEFFGAEEDEDLE